MDFQGGAELDSSMHYPHIFTGNAERRMRVSVCVTEHKLESAAVLGVQMEALWVGGG